MLLSGRLNDEEQDAVHSQMEEITRLNAIIDDLLFLSRADVKAVKMSMSLENADEFMRSFIQDAIVLTEYHHKRFDYSYDCSHEVRFDPKWMRQVLLNLTVNAINASPPGGLIKLRSHLIQNCWQISVDNEGATLSADERERMFERFVRFWQRVKRAEYQSLTRVELEIADRRVPERRYVGTMEFRGIGWKLTQLQVVGQGF